MMEEHKETATKLWMELAKERSHLDAVCTEDEVEHEATWCQATLRKVLDVTTKNIRICAKSKSWWNRDIKAKRKTHGQEKIRHGRHSEAAARAKAAL